MPSTSTAVSEDAIRTRAYLLWEADGRPFGRDAHYWGLALAEATAPAVKPKRAAASVRPAEKKSKAKRVKPGKAKAPVGKTKKSKP